jgi:hypothetical protein
VCSSRLATVRKGLSRMVLSLSKSGAGLEHIGEDADMSSRVTCPGIAKWSDDLPAVGSIECRVQS